MRFFFILLCGLMLTHFPLTAGEHTLSSQISYHSEQNSATGYGLIYQYQLLENFEFEVKYQQSGDLKIISNDKILYGDYSSFSSGINFTKLHHQDLTLKLGLGINLISSSSNNLLVEKDAVAAYFQIAASYQVTNNLSLTFGQSSHFNQNALGTNHSLFFSLNWLFSSNTSSYSKPSTNKDRTSAKTRVASVVVQPKTILATPKTSEVHIATMPMWYVQIGAYQQLENAHQKLVFLNNKSPVSFRILLHKDFYRVLSQPFSSKTAALEHLLYLESNFSIKGFVNKI
jgi:cell division septation protein DedD